MNGLVESVPSPSLRVGNNLSEIAAAGGAAQAAARANIGAAAAAPAIADSVVTRAVYPWLFFDGITADGRAYCALGAAGAMSAQARTLLGKIYVPTTAECAGKSWILYNLGNSNITAAGASGDGWVILVNTSGSNLFVRQYGPTAADVQRWNSTAALDTSYGGRVVPIAVVQLPGAAPTVYLDGVPFAGTDVGPVGAANAWGTHSCAFMRFGGNGGSVPAKFEIGAPLLINRELTAAEILAHAITGRAPNSDQMGTGSMVNKITGTSYNFSAGVGNWTEVGAGSIAADAANSELDVSFTTANEYASSSIIAGLIVAGRRYRWKVTIRNWVGVGTVRFQTGGGNQVIGDIAGDGTYTYDFEATAPATGMLVYRLSASACSFSIFQPTLLELGPIARHEILPGAIIHPDSSDNKLALVTTPGCVPVGDLPDQIYLQGAAMTGDGFVHLDQIITPTGYELVSGSVLQALTAVSTITVKETSAAGATVATAVLSATANRVVFTISNGLIAGNSKKLHLANSAWGGNTVTPFFLFRRAY